MRTTLVIDDYVMRELKEKAHRTGQPLKKLVNEAIRLGLAQLERPSQKKPYQSKTYSMGYPPGEAWTKLLKSPRPLKIWINPLNPSSDR